MPLIKVQTTVSASSQSEVETMLKTLSAKLAKHTSKPESYVMVLFEGGISMTFARKH
jgi:phenylpyruvate tautomerase